MLILSKLLYGKTALTTAEEEGHSAIIALLTQNVIIRKWDAVEWNMWASIISFSCITDRRHCSSGGRRGRKHCNFEYNH